MLFEDKLPYYNAFDYQNMEEIVVILENTITEIVQHANLSYYQKPSLCLIDGGKHGIFRTELELKDNVTNPEFYEKRDLKILNKHFCHLQERYETEYKHKDSEFSYLCQKNDMQLQTYGYSEIDLDRAHLAFTDFCKKKQYFLCTCIRFESLARASYDRYGRISVLKFKIMF